MSDDSKSISTKPSHNSQLLADWVTKNSKTKEQPKAISKPVYPDAQEEWRKIEEAKKLVKECQDRLEAKLTRRKLRSQDTAHP